MTKKKLISGIVAGVAIGGVLGYLFATEKGSKTRQRIAEETTNFFDEIVGHFMDIINKGKDKAQDTVASAGSALEKVTMSGQN